MKVFDENERSLEEEYQLLLNAYNNFKNNWELNYTLAEHPKNYALSMKELFFSIFVTFLGHTYAKRHWELSKSSEPHNIWKHQIIALIEFIPVIGGFAMLAERVAVFVHNKYFC